MPPSSRPMLLPLIIRMVYRSTFQLRQQHAYLLPFEFRGGSMIPAVMWNKHQTTSSRSKSVINLSSQSKREPFSVCIHLGYNSVRNRKFWINNSLIEEGTRRGKIFLSIYRSFFTLCLRKRSLFLPQSIRFYEKWLAWVDDQNEKKQVNDRPNDKWHLRRIPVDQIWHETWSDLGEREG